MNNNRGFVLIYILAMVAFVSSALVLFQTKSIDFTKRVDVLLKETDALYMAYSPIILTSQLIKDDLLKGQIDGVGDDWYRFTKPQSFPIDNGEIKLMIRDAGSVPDMNALFTGTAKDNYFIQAVQTYLGYLKIAPSFAGVIRDWVDVDNQPNPFGGTEISGNINTVIPNKNIYSPADIRLIKGYSEDVASLMGVNFSYLPSPAPVNVNTISPSFLKALFAGKPARVNYVISKRNRQPFLALGEFYEELNIDKPTKAVEFTMQTTYFTTYAEINMYGVTKKIEALFERRYGKVKLRRLLWN